MLRRRAVLCHPPKGRRDLAICALLPQESARRMVGVGLCMLAHMKLILRWLLLAAALLVVAQWCPGVAVRSFGAALLAAFVLGLLNAVLRPLLIILTLPVTVPAVAGST